MDYETKIKIAASLCQDVEDVGTCEYLRGISEFLADSEELNEEKYGVELDVRSLQVRNDIEKQIEEMRRA